jgi:hypothetical protein
MAVDLSVFGRQNSIIDMKRLQEEFALKKQAQLAEIQSALTKANNPNAGNSPAAIQIADEIAKARASGDVQRLNDIGAAAKMFDRGIGYGQDGGFSGLGGYGEALAGLKGQIKGAETGAKLQLEAQNALPNAYNTFQEQSTLLQDLIDNPDLGNVTGFKRGGGAIGIPFTGGKNFIMSGSKAAGLQAKLDQVRGGNFLQAIQSMKGTGQITEIEGAKAEQALARLNQSQSDADFKKSLADYQKIIGDIYNAAQQRAGMGQRANSGVVADELNRMTNNNPMAVPQNTYGANPNLPLGGQMGANGKAVIKAEDYFK